MSVSVRTIPIILRLARGATHPQLNWTLVDPDDEPINLDDDARVATLYYSLEGARPGDPAFWKADVTKSATPVDGGISYNVTENTPFAPASVTAKTADFVGHLRYVDNNATPPIDVWIEDVLRVTMYTPPADPTP